MNQRVSHVMTPTHHLSLWALLPRFLLLITASLLISALIALELGKSFALAPEFYATLVSSAGGDVYLHFAVSFLFYLGTYFFISTLIVSTQVSLGSFLLVLMVISISEFSQLFIATRTFQVTDLLAGYSGTTLAWFVSQSIAVVIARYREMEPPN